MQANTQNRTAVLMTAFAVYLMLFSSGCGARYIDSPIVSQDAKIKKTPEREAVMVVMEDYSEALSTLDIERLTSLLSADYYENGGTTHTSEDDYGYEGITNLFKTLKEHIADINVRMAIREINIGQEGIRADVLFDYEYTMLYRVGDSERWSTERDVNRVELENIEGVWKITSGL